MSGGSGQGGRGTVSIRLHSLHSSRQPFGPFTFLFRPSSRLRCIPGNWHPVPEFSFTQTLLQKTLEFESRSRSTHRKSSRAQVPAHRKKKYGGNSKNHDVYNGGMSRLFISFSSSPSHVLPFTLIINSRNSRTQALTCAHASRPLPLPISLSLTRRILTC